MMQIGTQKQKKTLQVHVLSGDYSLIVVFICQSSSNYPLYVQFILSQIC